MMRGFQRIKFLGRLRVRFTVYPRSTRIRAPCPFSTATTQQTLRHKDFYDFETATFQVDVAV
jgi:hypothetical protein